MRTRLALTLALATSAACDLAYPEVVVVNRTREPVQLRNLSFNGCVWDTVLAYGEATGPGRCLPGEDRVHFEKLDAASYCREQAEDGTLEGVCPCSAEGPRSDAGLVNLEPTWFAYQTVKVHRVDYGEYLLVEIAADDMEQDFSVPGPYGH